MQKLFLFLEQIITDPIKHAKFLNTLSLLEFSGAQKLAQITKYLPTSNFFLEHICEEFRHAYYLRNLAHKINPDLTQEYTKKSVYNFFLSKNYLTKLNIIFIKILKQKKSYYQLESHNHAYYLITYFIEQRALKFYSEYQNLLTKYKIPISLKSIISEEERHLQEMQAKIREFSLSSTLLQQLQHQETQIFNHWSTNIQKHERVQS